MDEYEMYNACCEKLMDLCAENNLYHSLSCTNYPCTLAIYPAGGMDAQISMLEAAEEQGYTSPNASITMRFIDGEIRIETRETFTIADALLSKIKRIFTNLYSAYTQYFFRDAMERGLQPAGAADLREDSGRAATEAAEEADFDEFFEADDPEADE